MSRYRSPSKNGQFQLPLGIGEQRVDRPRVGFHKAKADDQSQNLRGKPES